MGYKDGEAKGYNNYILNMQARVPSTTEIFEQKRTTRSYPDGKMEVSRQVNLDPTKYGWARDEASRLLIPIMVPPNVALATSEVLEMIPWTRHATQRNVGAQQPHSVLVGEKRAAGMNKHRQLQHLPVTKTDDNE